MQTNVHLAVAGDKEALAVLGAAFEQGVPDIIAFDYWSKEFDAIKEKARDKSLAAARWRGPTLIHAQRPKSTYYSPLSPSSL